MNRRGSGILMHISSLPSSGNIGDCGPGARLFADFLVRSKQSWWQILPLNPTASDTGYSPYRTGSVLAGNPLLISHDDLVSRGLLSKEDIENTVVSSDLSHVEYGKIDNFKKQLLDIAFRKASKMDFYDGYFEFCMDNMHWLEDHALFVALKATYNGTAWNEWPAELANRHELALKSARERLGREIEKEKFIQYIFNAQWKALKTYCNDQGIRIIGDSSLYVSYDSVDVWTHRELFKLGADNKPLFIAGVPPDRFGPQGQIWGMPVYNWENHMNNGFAWWKKRFARMFQLYDVLRLDHFRGFISAWEIPVAEKDAKKGTWHEVPTTAFFETISRSFSHLPVIAEDLGTITAGIRETQRNLDIPGMKLLIFAFDNDDHNNTHLPHTYPPDCIAYTGNHDTNTVRGWFEDDADNSTRERLYRYAGMHLTAHQVPDTLIRLLMMSASQATIFPMQDMLGLGSETRMNNPESQSGKWDWRITTDMLTDSICNKLGELTETYGRG